MVGRATYALPENPTLGPKLHGFEPVYPWDRPRPIPSETMISIKRLKLTGAAQLGLTKIEVLTCGPGSLSQAVR